MNRFRWSRIGSGALGGLVGSLLVAGPALATASVRAAAPTDQVVLGAEVGVAESAEPPLRGRAVPGAPRVRISGVRRPRAAREACSAQATGSTIAQAKGTSVAVFGAENAPQPKRSLYNPGQFGESLVFRVVKPKGDWLNVMLPTRPNGSTGWVRAGDVVLSCTPYRLEIDLRAHRFTLHKGPQTVLNGSVAIGKRSTPTPRGEFYTTMLIETGEPHGAYGPYAFGLSAHSTVLKQFAGGDGQVGVHGTNQPKLIGRDVSHGCIRMSNKNITQLARLLPLGAPVSVH